MKDFNKGNGKRFGGGFGGGRDRGPATMYPAVCDQCGKQCEVPFRPTGDKPVYCNACFESKRGDSHGGGRFSPRGFGGGQGKGGNSDELKKQLQTLNIKIDRLIQLTEIIAKVKPAADKEKKAAPAAKAKKTKKASKK